MHFMGTDLLNLVLPHLDTERPSKAVYLGLVVLVLCVLALWKQPRKVAILVLLIGPLLVLTLGTWPTVAGHPVGIRGPAWYLVDWFPSLRGLSHWHRAVGAVVPFLGAMAAVGASVVLGWVPARFRTAAALALCGLLVVDGVALSQTAWPRRGIVPEVPASLTSLEPGGVIQLPFDNARVPFTETSARLYNRWQVVHGRRVSENYEGVDVVLAGSVLVSAADVVCGLRPTIPRDQQAARRDSASLREMGEAELAQEVAQLRGWGYRWIVLHSDRARTPGRARELLTDALGDSKQVQGDHIWDLDAVGGVWGVGDTEEEL